MADYGQFFMAADRWRRKRVATVVRDAPSEAIEALRERGYKIELPKPAPKDKRDKLRAI
ncbi:MAG: hypothetical protein PHQ28_09755 [Mycobacterium sp.]|nr:hypothetical protein [Mycobacterium sp.]